MILKTQKSFFTSKATTSKVLHSGSASNNPRLQWRPYHTRVGFYYPALLKAFRLSNAQQLLKAAEKYRKKKSDWSIKNIKRQGKEKMNCHSQNKKDLFLDKITLFKAFTGQNIGSYKITNTACSLHMPVCMSKFQKTGFG